MEILDKFKQLEINCTTDEAMQANIDVKVQEESYRIAYKTLMELIIGIFEESNCMNGLDKIEPLEIESEQLSFICSENIFFRELYSMLNALITPTGCTLKEFQDKVLK